jgi:hypothetical protein
LRLVELTIAAHRDRLQQNPSLSDLLEADRWAGNGAAASGGAGRHISLWHPSNYLMNLPYIFSVLLLVFGFGFVIFWLSWAISSPPSGWAG